MEKLALKLARNIKGSASWVLHRFKSPGISLGHDKNSVLFHYYCEFDAIEILNRFAVPAQSPGRNYVGNFLGVKVPTSVFPPILDSLAGTVEPIPNPGNWHADIAEWSSALLAVDKSEGTFRMIELGCGWACWMTNMGVVAKRHGRRIDLIGVEGDSNHLKNAVRILEANGLEEHEYKLFHGIAAPKQGKAIFPNPEAGTAAWGGEAVFYPNEEQIAEATGDPGKQVLDCYTIKDLCDGELVDLLHIDIQGAETDFVRGNYDFLERYIKRILIGTHSRIIDGELQAFLLENGWMLEMERPALEPLQNGKPVIAIDGVQLWMNPKLVK